MSEPDRLEQLGDACCSAYDGSTPCECSPAPWRAERQDEDYWHIYDANENFVREVFGEDADEYSAQLAAESESLELAARLALC